MTHAELYLQLLTMQYVTKPSGILKKVIKSQKVHMPTET